MKPSINETCGGVILSPTSDNYESINVLVQNDVVSNTTFSIRCTVYDDSRSSDTSVLISVLESNVAKVSILSSSTKINPSNKLVLLGQVDDIKTQSELSWTVSNAGGGTINVADYALTPLITTVDATQSIVSNFVLSPNATQSIVSNFVLSPNALPEGLTLSFTLKWRPLSSSSLASTASITIITNAPPTPGLFTISPSSGQETKDKFEFSAYRWNDDDRPLSFAFSYYDSKRQLQEIKARSEISLASSLLPAGQDINNFTISCTAQVYDVYDAYAIATKDVQVTILEISSDDLSKQVAASLAAASQAVSLDASKQTIAMSSSMLNRVSCANAPNCPSLNRENCSTVENTCGTCKDGYTGDDGPSNNLCVSSNSTRAIRRLLSSQIAKTCIENCSGSHDKS